MSPPNAWAIQALRQRKPASLPLALAGAGPGNGINHGAFHRWALGVQFAGFFLWIPIHELEVKPLLFAAVRSPGEHDDIQHNSRFRQKQPATLDDRDVDLDGARNKIPTNAQLPPQADQKKPFLQRGEEKATRPSSHLHWAFAGDRAVLVGEMSRA